MLIGVAILIFIFEVIPLNIRAFVGGLCLVFGLALYYMAIKIFDQHRLAPNIIKKTFAVVVVMNIAITLFSSNEYNLIVFNTALCVVLSVMSAMFLLKKRKVPKKLIEHQLTGIFFGIFACLTCYRLFILSSDQINPVEHLTQWAQNEITFLACMLSVLAINFGFIAMVNAKLTEQLKHAAGHDWLTGVMNRGMLEQAAQIMKANSNRMGHTQSLLLMDLDGFKNINDSHGHLFGDKVIKIFAKLASENIREIDVLGRYGERNSAYYCQIRMLLKLLHWLNAFANGMHPRPFL